MPCFFLALTFNINGLVDSMLAGVFFSSAHIAAIGIAVPSGMIASAILLALVQGTVMFYATALGRGSRNKINEMFSFGVYAVIATGMLLTIVSILLSRQIVTLFGAKTPELREYASQYLCFNSLTYAPNSLAQLIFLILGTYGYQKDMAWANLLNFFTNLVFSILFIKLLPDIGIGALGLGTFVSSIVYFVSCVIIVRVRSLRLPLVRVKLSAKTYYDTIVKGSASSLDKLIDGTISAVINGIIVSSALGVDGIAIYTVVKSIWQLSQVSAEGMGYTLTPMSALFYGAKDKNGVKTSFSDALKLGMVLSIVWAVLLYLCMPLLLRIYSGAGDIENAVEIIRTGTLTTLLFAPLFMFLYLLGSFFDATDNSTYCVILFVIPDSVIFPILAFLAIKLSGYAGLWISFAGNSAIFIVGYYIVYLIKNKKLSIDLEDILFLKNGMCEKCPALDVSIRYEDNDISALSQKIHSYLTEEGASKRVAYIVALCMDELASNIVRHSRRTEKAKDTPIMDIKILSDERRFKILIRNMSTRYNPFETDHDDDEMSKVGIKMVQKFAYKIRYNYFYQSNIITINIDKNAVAVNER